LMRIWPLNSSSADDQPARMKALRLRSAACRRETDAEVCDAMEHRVRG
jgi:hypothetical protein